MKFGFWVLGLGLWFETSSLGLKVEIWGFGFRSSRPLALREIEGSGTRDTGRFE